MATPIEVLAPGSYPAATRNVGPVSIPVGITGFILVLDASAFPGVASGFQASINAERSLDGGATWEGAGGAGFDGTIQPQVGFTVDLPEPDNANRRLRATIVTNQAVTTSATLTTLP